MSALKAGNFVVSLIVLHRHVVAYTLSSPFSNFAFLQAVARDFTGIYSARRIKNCNAYALDKDFSPKLRSTMHYYNINHTRLSRDQQVNQLMAKVEDLKSVLGRNIELMLERETQLDALMAKSEMARRDSLVFKKRSVKLKNHFWWKSYKLWILIALTLLVFVYTMITASCGIRFQYCRGSNAYSDGSSDSNSGGN